nr:MAG TPA: hypothetical protein [Caudoviricetes sp.]
MHGSLHAMCPTQQAGTTHSTTQARHSTLTR